jgi:hypothetical protein
VLSRTQIERRQIDGFENKDLTNYVSCSKKGNYFVRGITCSVRKIQVFWNMTPCCGVFPDVSRHHSAFVLRVKLFHASSRARIYYILLYYIILYILKYIYSYIGNFGKSVNISIRIKCTIKNISYLNNKIKTYCNY